MNPLTYATAQLLRVLPRAQVSRAMGKLADVSWSPALGRAVLGAYCKAYDVSFDECKKSDGWKSFDKFVTRELKDGARPIDPNPAVLVSPADGRIESMGPVDGTSTFMVKGRPYSVAELIGDEAEAKRYVGGAGAVVYLSPRDYHRVHSPIAGTITSIRSMPGDYYPVNSIGLDHIDNLFAINRRVSFAIDAAPESKLGRVTVVMVAAIVVGRITASGIDARDVPIGLHTLSKTVAKGEEIGIFHLGSTAVVFVEKSAFASWLTSEGPVLCGAPFIRSGGDSAK